MVEGRIDFDVLRQLLGDAVEDREEKYGLTWHGKRRARQIALTPSTGTLRPCPEESVDWDTTQNLMIEGDNLEVLKLLQKSYAGKVKLIYIDPPYNTGKDFVYPDDFRDNIKNYLELTGQVDGDGRRLSTNTEASGRFHTDWLNMMYPRLKLARSLLTRRRRDLRQHRRQRSAATSSRSATRSSAPRTSSRHVVWKQQEGSARRRGTSRSTMSTSLSIAQTPTSSRRAPSRWTTEEIRSRATGIGASTSDDCDAVLAPQHLGEAGRRTTDRNLRTIRLSVADGTVRSTCRPAEQRVVPVRKTVRTWTWRQQERW